jgi:hypothetical protein
MLKSNRHKPLGARQTSIESLLIQSFLDRASPISAKAQKRPTTSAAKLRHLEDSQDTVIPVCPYLRREIGLFVFEATMHGEAYDSH